MINCLILEDEPLAREVLEAYLKEFPDFHLLASCSRASEARSLMKSEKIDLLFLDINLPDNSGLNFYKSLTHKPQLIFTTAYPEFGVEGFELEALDYLLKPFSFERFQRALNKFTPSSKIKEDFIMLKADKRRHKVNYQSICYFEAVGDYVKVILEKNENLIISERLKNLEADLPKDFVRCHKSFIIALSKLRYIEGNQLKIGDRMIPMGPSYRDQLQKLLTS